MTSKGEMTTTADSLIESFTSGHDGTRLYVRQQPTRAAFDPGVTAVFSDGLLCDGFIWKYLWDDVAARMPVAHWHYRGHGRSAVPVNADALAIHHHAADLDKVCTFLGDPDVVLFGHSMGCQVSLDLYRLRPEKVNAIVLVCGSYGRVTETFKGSNVLSQVLPSFIDRVLAAPEVARAIWSRIPPEVALTLGVLTGDIDGRTIQREDILPYLSHLTHVDFPMFLKMLRAAGEHTAEEHLDAIKCPVLIIAGERDSFTPASLSEHMATRIPNAELLIARGATHVAPLEQRELIGLRIDKFLRDRVLQNAATPAPPAVRPA
jgi:pimeloyl-ACP methyl ester carboxylesterase